MGKELVAILNGILKRRTIIKQLLHKEEKRNQCFIE